MNSNTTSNNSSGSEIYRPPAPQVGVHDVEDVLVPGAPKLNYIILYHTILYYAILYHTTILC